jgi:hypothetical protein
VLSSNVLFLLCQQAQLLPGSQIMNDRSLKRNIYNCWSFCLLLLMISPCAYLLQEINFLLHRLLPFKVTTSVVKVICQNKKLSDIFTCFSFGQNRKPFKKSVLHENPIQFADQCKLGATGHFPLPLSLSLSFNLDFLFLVI